MKRRDMINFLKDIGLLADDRKDFTYTTSDGRRIIDTNRLVQVDSVRKDLLRFDSGYRKHAKRLTTVR